MRGNFSNHFCDYYCVCAGKRNRSLLFSPTFIRETNVPAWVHVTTGVRNQREGFFCDVVIARLCTSAARQLKQQNRIPTARFPFFFCKICNFLSFFLFRSPNRVLCSHIMLKWSPSHRARVGTPDPSEVGSEVASITSEQAGR